MCCGEREDCEIDHVESTKTQCDYLCGWIKKWLHTQKSHAEQWNQKYIWERRRRSCWREREGPHTCEKRILCRRRRRDKCSASLHTPSLVCWPWLFSGSKPSLFSQNNPLLIHCNITHRHTKICYKRWVDIYRGSSTALLALWLRHPLQEWRSRVRFLLAPWGLFQVESYQWLKNWHSSGYLARLLAL